MIIYLVEDDERKAELLSAFIMKIVPDVTVSVFRSYQSGLKALRQVVPTIAFIDMTLPTFDATPESRTGRSRSLGGYDLMRKMKRLGMTVPVFVVTQLETFGDGDTQISFEEISTRCQNEFSTFFWGAVHFSQNSDGWQSPVEGALQKLGSRGNNLP